MAGSLEFLIAGDLSESLVGRIAGVCVRITVLMLSRFVVVVEASSGGGRSIGLLRLRGYVTA